MEYRHIAYNLTTGEVLTTIHANALKRAVKAWTTNGDKWIFSHHGWESIKKKL